MIDYIQSSFTNPPLVLPVVFTLITEEEEAGEELRAGVEAKLMQFGAELRIELITIAFEEVERFGKCTCKN